MVTNTSEVQNVDLIVFHSCLIRQLLLETEEDTGD